MESSVGREEIIPAAGIGRELRRVPLWWEHPLHHNGRPKQLMPRESLDGFEEYLEPGEELTPEYIAENFMPDFSDVPQEEMGVCVYHCEGEPASPTFPDTPAGQEELLQYAADNISTWAGSFFTDAEGWRHILFEDDCHYVHMNTGQLLIDPPSAVRAARWQVTFALSDGPKSPLQAAEQSN